MKDMTLNSHIPYYGEDEQENKAPVDKKDK
jgi:hypothetical protein